MAIPRSTKAEFVRKSQQRWGDKYGYDRVHYVNSRTPVVLFCHHHQSYFEQTPKAHFMTKHECCPLCYQARSGSFQNAWRARPVPPVKDLSHCERLLLRVFSAPAT